MVQALSISENIHTILRVLYDDMMVLCYPMAKVATAIAGIGALIYIAYRIWQTMARAEPIDLFPLLRPMAIGICIMFFPTLVLGSLNGILSPLVQATHSLMVGQTFNMQEWRQECARLEQESRERLPAESYYTEDEEKERELQALGIDEQSQQALDRMQSERKSWSIKGMILKALTAIMELFFAAAGVILDVLRCSGPSPSPSRFSMDFRIPWCNGFPSISPSTCGSLSRTSSRPSSPGCKPSRCSTMPR